MRFLRKQCILRTVTVRGMPPMCAFQARLRERSKCTDFTQYRGIGCSTSYCTQNCSVLPLYVDIFSSFGSVSVFELSARKKTSVSEVPQRCCNKFEAVFPKAEKLAVSTLYSCALLSIRFQCLLGTV